MLPGIASYIFFRVMYFLPFLTPLTASSVMHSIACRLVSGSFFGTLLNSCNHRVRNLVD